MEVLFLLVLSITSAQRLDSEDVFEESQQLGRTGKKVDPFSKLRQSLGLVQAINFAVLLCSRLPSVWPAMNTSLGLVGSLYLSRSGNVSYSHLATAFHQLHGAIRDVKDPFLIASIPES